MEILEISAALISCVGVVYVSLAKVKGLWILTVGQTLWIAFSYINSHDFFLAQGVFMWIVNVYGIYNWKKKKVGV